MVTCCNGYGKRWDKRLISLYKRAITKAAHAESELRGTREAIVREGCPHPEVFVQDWKETLYQVGPVNLGRHCTICDWYFPGFGRGGRSDVDGQNHESGTHECMAKEMRCVYCAGWNTLEEARKENIACCPHLEAWHTVDRWHHGYGKYVNGVRCALCASKKSFPSQGYWTPYAEWSQWKKPDRDD